MSVVSAVSRPSHHALCCLMAALSLPLAHAETATGSFQVSTTVISACTVSGALLNFGNSINPLAAAVPVDASTTLTVQCTNTTPYSVALDAGLNAGGAANFGARRMASGANTLAYQLHLDAARTSVWGDGSGGSSTSAGVGTGSTQALTVYGRLANLDGAVPGAYADTVTVTITY